MGTDFAFPPTPAQEKPWQRPHQVRGQGGRGRPSAAQISGPRCPAVRGWHGELASADRWDGQRKGKGEGCAGGLEQTGRCRKPQPPPGTDSSDESRCQRPGLLAQALQSTLILPQGWWATSRVSTCKGFCGEGQGPLRGGVPFPPFGTCPPPLGFP